MRTSYRNPQGDNWYRSIMENPALFPMTFTYDGVRYQGFDPDCFTLISQHVERKDHRECMERSYSLTNEMQVTVHCAHDFLHGATEWKLIFENVGQTTSCVLENVETTLRFAGDRPMLKGIMGDQVNAYRPYSMDVCSQAVHFENNSGRATHVTFPYFNLEYGDQGVMLAIGWGGTWTADFVWNGQETEYAARSVNHLHTRLRPGEKVRTALFLHAPYKVRQESYATNYWRDWYVQNTLPPMDEKGTPLAPFSTCCLANDTGLPNSDGSISENHTTWRRSMEKMLQEDVRVDFRWFDAGWYEAPDGTSPDTDWWGTVGTWKLDAKKWPGTSFRESTDFARAHGMKTLMWFEPERVTDPDNLVKHHGYKKEWAIVREGERTISNNIGDPDCLVWTIDRITSTLRENRVEMYREDNNCNPAALWRYLDEKEGEDRQGITECKFIDAHYRMWDALIACTLSYGGCGFVDSCASGGGRNDLESMRRGVPLLRSDADRTSTALRLSMTTALNKWLPFCGANTKEKKAELDAVGISDPYVWRASYLAVLNVESQFYCDLDQDFDVLRFGLREWDRVKPYLLKDFYTHTPWHPAGEKTGFTAFSYVDPDTDEGVLLAFRQEDCVENTLYISLPYVEKGKVCMLTDEDSGETWMYDPAQHSQLSLCFDKPRTARLLWIRVVNTEKSGA